MENNIKFAVALNFAGFYQSIHDDNIEARIAQILEDEELPYDEVYEHIPYKAIYTEYAKRYVLAFNNYFDLNLEFLELDSPREYNFRTDVIMVNMCMQDYNYLWLETDQDYINDKIKDASTARDGFQPFYNYSQLLAQPEFMGEFLLDYILNNYEEALDWEDMSWLDDFIYQAIESYKQV
jgi:hypothetical protein